ncbi:MAG: serine/threonine-protein kinase [Thermodesulfobacteriota bacterium]
MEAVGRYRILSEIGSGSVGVVYRAHDPNLDVDVALKVLRRERLSDEGLVRRFLSEAKALGRLEHPNTVRVFNVDTADGTVYIAMELVEGESLSQAAKNRRLAPAEVAELGATVAEALEEAHTKGIVHRDVKPGNILIRSDGRIKITDFGIARIESLAPGDRTEVGQILGTPSYMSPEQVAGQPVDARSDLFSLGIILYELATGAKPFAGDNLAAVFFAIAHKEPEAPCRRNPALPRELENIILRCLQKDPQARFPTAAALAQALRAHLAGSVQPASGGARATTPRRRAAWGAALAAGVLAAGAGLYFASRPEPPPAQYGTLRIETAPPGAQLFVGGAFQGLTPATLSVAAGRHDVRLTYPGRGDWEARVLVKAEGETPLSIELAPVEDSGN